MKAAGLAKKDQRMRRFEILKDGQFIFCKKGDVVCLIDNQKSPGKSWWKIPRYSKKHSHMVFADVDFLLENGGIKELKNHAKNKNS